jgi:CrcB protein
MASVREAAAVAVGGATGSALRYGLGVLWPDATGAFPWTTFAINVTGCLAIGLLVAVLGNEPGWLRALLGTGFLGAYAEQARQLLAGGRVVVAAVYVFGTVAAALVAVALGLRVRRP